jgi:hypothetical protein
LFFPQVSFFFLNVLAAHPSITRPYISVWLSLRQKLRLDPYSPYMQDLETELQAQRKRKQAERNEKTKI